MTVRSDAMTWKRVGCAYWRGVRLLSRYIPHLFTSITLHTLAATSTPYIAIYVAARIVRDLLEASDAQTMWLSVVFALGITGCLMLVGGALGRWKESKWDLLMLSVDSILTDGLLSLDFADADAASTRELLDRVHEESHALGMGLHSLPNIYQNILAGLIGAINTVALTWGLFVLPVPDTAGALTRLNDPLCVSMVAAAVPIGSFVASWMSKKAGDYFRADMNTVAARDRSYEAFNRSAFDPASAADVRIYRQDRLILSYLQEVKNSFFGAGGVKSRQAKGSCGVLRACSSGVSVLLTGTVYAFAALKALGGAFDIAAMTQYIGAFAVLSKHLSDLFLAVDHLRIHTPYLETVYSFLDIPHSMYQGTLTTEKRRDRDYDVSFRGVSFRYPQSEHNALNDITVSLRVGSRVAVVGENGSGKSTFIKLLCRLYDPDEGEILLNGIDVRKYDRRDYSRIFSVVFQDFQLLAQPLADNVAGAACYEEERVKQCLEDVGLDMPLDTPLTERAAEVAVGDAQKIAIARALYKNAPFMILDEPTAALDPVAEAAVYESLDRIVGDRTAIYISHRLSSCRFCDEILVFDQGRIVQRGTHEALISHKGGKYRELWDAQARYYHHSYHEEC